ncbi:MAG: hypothetical protein HY055_08640 [Magnetospirillum sp.]|nr:hypothetical protein [Magnetospirillum sp.]
MTDPLVAAQDEKDVAPAPRREWHAPTMREFDPRDAQTGGSSNSDNGISNS